MESHAYQRRVTSGTRLSTLLESTAPHMGGPGWSWVALADGAAVATWSIDHGVQMLVPDTRVTRRNSPVKIHFSYFLQIDPLWLHRRLADGAEPDRAALSEEYRPLQEEKWEQEQRQREREISDRLISTTCTAILKSFGAELDLHNDQLLRFYLHGVRWSVSRSDTMISVYWGGKGCGASIRSLALAECFLVSAAASHARAATDLPRFPDFDTNPMPELRRMSDWPPGLPRWSTTGDPIIRLAGGYDPVAQLSGEESVACFRFMTGRSLDEIARLLAYSSRE